MKTILELEHAELIELYKLVALNHNQDARLLVVRELLQMQLEKSGLGYYEVLNLINT